MDRRVGKLDATVRRWRAAGAIVGVLLVLMVAAAKFVPEDHHAAGSPQAVGSRPSSHNASPSSSRGVPNGWVEHVIPNTFPVEWSSDGRYLALASWRSSASAPGNHGTVLVTDRDGRIIAGPFDGASPTWIGPTQLAFISTSNGIGQTIPSGPILSVDLRTGGSRTVVADSVSGRLLGDGNGLLALVDAGGLGVGWRADLGGPPVSHAVQAPRTTIYDAQTGVRIATLPAMIPLDWDRHGDLLAQAPVSWLPGELVGSGPLSIFDSASRQLRSIGAGLSDKYQEARFSPDGSVVACACYAATHGGSGKSAVTDAYLLPASGAPSRRLTSDHAVSAFRQPPLTWLDAHTIAIIDADRVRLFDDRTGQPTPNGELTGASADGVVAGAPDSSVAPVVLVPAPQSGMTSASYTIIANDKQARVAIESLNTYTPVPCPSALAVAVFADLSDATPSGGTVMLVLATQ